jgi:hypothetical protein
MDTQRPKYKAKKLPQKHQMLFMRKEVCENWEPQEWKCKVKWKVAIWKGYWLGKIRLG